MRRCENIKASQKGNTHTHTKPGRKEALLIRIISIIKWHPKTKIIGNSLKATLGIVETPPTEDSPG